MAKKATTTSKAAANGIDASMRIVLLQGPEDMVKREHLQGLRSALEAAHGEVDVFSFEGKSAELSAVMDELRGYSLMASYKLVIVDEAEEFAKRHREALERYAASPVDHATLVLRAGTWHPGNLDKLIKKVGTIIKCEAPGPSEAVKWVVERATTEHGCKIERDAAALLVERMGAHLMALDTELGKLSASVGERGVVDRAAVESAVGRSNDEKAYALQNKLLAGMAKRSAGRMIEGVHELIDDGGQPDVLMMYMAADLLRKLAVGATMKRGGATEAQVNQAVKVWGPGVAPFHAVLRGLSDREARSMLDLALTLDGRGKSGLGDPTRNLERLCVALADE